MTNRHQDIRDLVDRHRRPRRVQMTRHRPWRRHSPDAVIVDRRSRWGNPWSVEVFGREQALWLYRHRTVPTLDLDQLRAELAGRDLACWCPPDQACHADILMELANDTETSAGPTGGER